MNMYISVNKVHISDTYVMIIYTEEKEIYIGHFFLPEKDLLNLTEIKTDRCICNLCTVL